MLMTTENQMQDIRDQDGANVEIMAAQ